MATEDRQPPAALNGFAAVQRTPEAFGFAAALRLLECACPDRPRLGRSLRPGEDALRLGQQPGLAFPPGPLAGFVPPARPGRPGRLLVHLFGLLGPNGPLPLHLTEYVLDRVRRHGDRALQDFLDVFHHRLLSLFWRAHACAEPAIEADRPDSDRFADRVLALSGFRLPGAGGGAAGHVRRYWTAHLAQKARNAEGLCAMLAGYFRMPIRIVQFVGRWLPMPGTGRCRLGGSAAGSQLGRTAFLGEEIWDCAQTVRIVCGPLSLGRYEQMLPAGASWPRLCELVRDYLGDELAWEAALVLRRTEVPQARLGSAVRLGWTSWLGSEPAARDRDDLVLRSDADYRHGP